MLLSIFRSLATLARNSSYILFTWQFITDKLKIPPRCQNICKFSARSLRSLAIVVDILFLQQCMRNKLKSPSFCQISENIRLARSQQQLITYLPISMHDRSVEIYIIDVKYLKMFFSLATLARNRSLYVICIAMQCMRDKLKMPLSMSNICKFSARS